MQGTQRYVTVAYLVLGLVIWVTLDRLFAGLTYLTGIPNPSLVGNFTVTTAIAAVATLAAGLYVLRNPRITEFSNDVVSELRKVTWPSRKETQSATVVVIITTIIIAIILGAMDFVWLRLTAVIYS